MQQAGSGIVLQMIRPFIAELPSFDGGFGGINGSRQK
jgi:hypothetical protein